MLALYEAFGPPKRSLQGFPGELRKSEYSIEERNRTVLDCKDPVQGRRKETENNHHTRHALSSIYSRDSEKLEPRDEGATYKNKSGRLRDPTGVRRNNLF